MSVDLDLLRRAWPDGYLAVKGASTRLNWICVHAGMGIDFLQWVSGGGQIRFDGSTWWYCGHKDWTGPRDRGDLLPNVTTSDTATWAAVKADLAAALEWPPDGELTWRRVSSSQWILTRHMRHLQHTLAAFGAALVKGDVETASALNDQELHATFDIDADDPALALVLARIHVREEKGR